MRAKAWLRVSLTLRVACLHKSGSGKGVFGKGVFSEESIFSRDSREFRDSRVSREPPRLWKNNGDSDHFLAVLEIFRDSRVSPVKRPLS